MGLTVVLLGKVAASALLLLRKAAEGVPLQLLFQHIAADDLPGQCQNLPHRLFQVFVRLLAQNQLRFQSVHLSPEENPAVVFGNQHLGIEMGHVLRLFFQESTIQQPVAFHLGLLRRQNGNPLPA